ncbi:Serine/threonine-protein kinase PknB [Rosistilla oblonga]|uniref:serine/threonine protein kinase n=1 Tax=Rosistilla oblonga TaxID=2527990 RepID=UPI00118B25C3|nr:serine/threonine protein kinase [Rosistilla oblonga]QDV15075.1 Serine/threonine-protein kinase PknB [Rosistilla oblonga]
MQHLNRTPDNPPSTESPAMSRQQINTALPIALLILALIAGVVIQGRVDDATKTVVGKQLTTIRNSSVSAVRLWFGVQESSCQRIADLVRAPAIAFERRSSARALSPRMLESDAQYQELRDLLADNIDPQRYIGWTLQSAAGVVLAAWDDSLVGRSGFPLPPDAMNRAIGGQATVSVPFRSPVPIETPQQKFKAGDAVMAAIAPIIDDSGRCGAVLALLISPAKDFTAVFDASQVGDSGETFAFNREGIMISRCRFEDELRTLGLLHPAPSTSAVLSIQLRDPEVDLRSGKRTLKPLDQQPFTRMALDATRGGTGVDTAGYNDCRGTRVIGAWNWLPEYGMGVATEIAMEEAYRPLNVLRWSNLGLLSLLMLTAATVAVNAIRSRRAESQASKEHRLARKLGQYRLEEVLGAGGMGSVYKAQHAMLMRPVAIKVLDTKGSDPQRLHRFKREVELTSQLQNPHTIAVFDYGQTQNGDFYYVMEYLDGVDLSELVRQYGELPASRAIAILLQICGSLIEAHGKGLIHRDIKPGNIMLTECGGIYDFAKLLDFGLVKESSPNSANVTHEGSLTGTPMYMSPEAIRNAKSVDPRSDIYSIGAVGYFLVTGKPLFDAAGTLDAILNQVQEEPLLPSERAGKPIDAKFEAVIMQCLSKNPNDRPDSVDDLVDLLEACPDQGDWNQNVAQQWWRDVFTGSQRRSTILSGKDTIIPTHGDNEGLLDARLTGPAQEQPASR